MTLASVYETSIGWSGPGPGVATTVVTLLLLPSADSTSVQKLSKLTSVQY